MAYSKNAFNCHKCPGKGGDGGCPAWWETVWEQPSPAGASTKIVKGCGYEQIPMYLIEVIKASNRPAAAVESMRNDLAGRVTAVLNQLRTFALPKPPNGD